MPDVDVAKAYYDELMPLLGFVREWNAGYVYQWAKEHDHRILHEPKLFPEYHQRFYATFFLDMHGFMLEAVTYERTAR